MGFFVHPSASIGGPPEHRKFIWRWYHGDLAQYSPPFFPPEFGDDVIVHEFCTVNAGTFQPTRVGDRSFLMARCHIGHDVQIGEDCELGAGVVICGEVVIGDRVRIGGNTWVKPQLKIGDGARIGGGAVVVKDVPAGEVWAGNPAKPLRTGREAAARGQSDFDHHQHYRGHLEWPDARHGEEVDWSAS